MQHARTTRLFAGLGLVVVAHNPTMLRQPTTIRNLDDEGAVDIFAKVDTEALETRKQVAVKQVEQRRQAAGTLLSRELRHKLSNGWVRVNDLFKSWDANGDGLITRREFMRGVAVVGVSMSHGDVSQLFSVFDKDESGQLDYRELHSLMRRGSTMLLPTHRTSAGGLARRRVRNMQPAVGLCAARRGVALLPRIYLRALSHAAASVLRQTSRD